MLSNTLCIHFGLGNTGRSILGNTGKNVSQFYCQVDVLIVVYVDNFIGINLAQLYTMRNG